MLLSRFSTWSEPQMLVTVVGVVGLNLLCICHVFFYEA